MVRVPVRSSGGSVLPRVLLFLREVLTTGRSLSRESSPHPLDQKRKLFYHKIHSTCRNNCTVRYLLIYLSKNVNSFSVVLSKQSVEQSGDLSCVRPTQHSNSSSNNGVRLGRGNLYVQPMGYREECLGNLFDLPPKTREHPNRVKGFVETVVPNYCDPTFALHFRKKRQGEG